MIKLNLIDVVQDQRYAEEGKWDLENEAGMWQYLRESNEEEISSIRCENLKSPGVEVRIGEGPSDRDLTDDQKNRINKIQNEYDKSRFDSLQEYQERLKPIPLGRIHLPQLPFVRLDPNDPENQPEHMKKYNQPFDAKKTYICLGEIAQMPGHVVVLDYITGEIYSGYHTERFEIIPVNEC